MTQEADGRIRDMDSIAPKAAAPHFDGERFFNPHAPHGKTREDFKRWRRERQRAPWPARIQDPVHPPPDHVGPDRIGATFIGHSTFLLQVGGIAILTDPIWSER